MGGILGRIQQKSCTSISFSTPFDANICKKNGRRSFFTQNIRFMVILFAYNRISYADILAPSVLVTPSVSAFSSMFSEPLFSLFTTSVLFSAFAIGSLIEVKLSLFRMASTTTISMAAITTMSINLRIIYLIIYSPDITPIFCVAPRRRAVQHCR